MTGICAACRHDEKYHTLKGCILSITTMDSRCGGVSSRCGCVSFVTPRSPLEDLSDGRKDDKGKLRYSLVPWRTLEEVVRVLEHGAAKYGADNWRKVPDARRRYADAAMRHFVPYLRALIAGEDTADINKDAETGLHHLAHAVCCLLFLLDLELEGGK